MHKLSPLVANSFVMSVVARELFDLKNKMQAEVKQNKFEMLDMLHHITSGLKPYFSDLAYDGID